MAVRATDVATMADIAKRVDKDGKLVDIVEILNQTNEVLTDMLWQQCNDGTGHKTSIRTGIPEATWRMFNYGVPQVKSQTANVRDTTGMLEVYAKCDKKLADLSGNPNGYRLSEAEAIMEGMSQQMARTVFYGNTNVNPERFMGLTPRYSTGLTSEAASAENVLDGGGRVALGQTSIWYVGWGQRATTGLYPQHSTSGLNHRNLGEDTDKDENGNEYQIYRDHFGWDCGLSVRDWRQNIRVANIDVAQLSDVTYMKTIINLMIEASEMAPTPSVDTNNASGDTSNNSGVRGVFYASRRVRSALRQAINDKVSNQLTWETFAGKKVVMFDSIPVRRVDALLSTEAVVPFA